MASEGARAYNWGLGAEPQRGPKGQSSRWGVRRAGNLGGEAEPPEADGILVLEHTFFALFWIL